MEENKFEVKEFPRVKRVYSKLLKDDIIPYVPEAIPSDFRAYFTSIIMPNWRFIFFGWITKIITKFQTNKQ